MFGRDFLSCSRGEYWLGINTMVAMTDDKGNHTVPGRLIVDGMGFPTTAHDGPDGVKVMVPVSALAAFKAGNRLTVQFQSGSGTFSAVFSLRGAGSAVDHVVALCKQGAPGAAPR